MTDKTYRKLSELTSEELDTLYQHNQDFQSKVWESVYEQNMFWQEQEYKNLFGLEDMRTTKVVAIHDHYSSFYLTLKDPINLVCVVSPDYLCEKGQPYWAECDKLEKQWSEMTTDEQESEIGEQLYNQLEQASENLLKAIEDQLHEYERVGEDQIIEELAQIGVGEHYMSNWKTDGKAVYEEIVKIYR